MRATRSWYGSVQIPRVFCARCKSWCFVLDGKRQCCGWQADAEVVRHKRMIQSEARRRKPPKRLQKELLEQFHEACAYCEQTFGYWIFYHGKPRRLRLDWDHEVPYAYLHANPGSNFLPACQVCNAWKHDRIFQTLEEVKVYVATKWEKERDSSKV